MKTYLPGSRKPRMHKFIDGIFYDYYMDLICDAVDKPIYRRFSYFHNCFNCCFFRSLSTNTDYCKLTGFTCKFNDLPCEDFKPIKLSWFYNDFKKE